MKTKLITTIGCLLLMAGFVKANPVLSFEDNGAGGGTGSSGSYLAGTSFTFDITLTVNNTGTDPMANVNGFSVWFETSAANTGFFTITSRTLSTFTDPNTIGATFPQPIVQGGGTAGDLGGTGATQVTNASYLVMSITIGIAAGTPAGTYTIATTTTASNPDQHNRSAASDGSFVAHPLPATTYTITVVPEPATLSLLGLGGLGSLGLTILRRRRKA